MKYPICSAALFMGCVATGALVGRPAVGSRHQPPGADAARNVLVTDFILTRDAPGPARINPFIYTPYDRPIYTGGRDKGELLYPKFMILWGGSSAARLQPPGVIAAWFRASGASYSMLLAGNRKHFSEMGHKWVAEEA